MSEISLKRFYFALFDDGLTFKTLKLAFIGVWIQTLHLYVLYYTFTFISQIEGFSDKKCYDSKSIHPNLLKFWENICFVKRKRLMIGFVGTCSIKQNVSVYVCIFWILQISFFNMKKAEYFEKASLKCSYMFILSTLSVNKGYTCSIMKSVCNSDFWKSSLFENLSKICHYTLVFSYMLKTLLFLDSSESKLSNSI